jgi:hypothetical protein
MSEVVAQILRQTGTWFRGASLRGASMEQKQELVRLWDKMAGRFLSHLEIDAMLHMHSKRNCMEEFMSGILDGSVRVVSRSKDGKDFVYDV